MIDLESLETQTGGAQIVPAVEPRITPANRIGPVEVFLQFAVVVAGIVLGAIAALFVGIYAGWIPLNLC